MLRKNKKIDFSFEWGWVYLPIWVFFFNVNIKERLNTGFEWVFCLQGLGLKFEWVKEYKNVNNATIRSFKRIDVTKKDNI